MLLQYSTTAPIYPRPVELSLLIFLQSKGIWIAVGKAFTNVSDEETKRLELLVDLAYTCATEAIAFVKFGALCEAQKRAGVGLGEQYLNIHAAKGFTKEFTMTLGHEVQDQLQQDLRNSDYVTVLADDSTDCSVTEKELIYVRFVDADGLVCTKLMALKDVQHADASGLLHVLKESFEHVGLYDYKKKLIGFMSDGATKSLMA